VPWSAATQYVLEHLVRVAAIKLLIPLSQMGALEDAITPTCSMTMASLVSRARQSKHAGQVDCIRSSVEACKHGRFRNAA